MKTILVTGGAGFIGSALVRYLVNIKECKVINVDKLTYAGNLSSLSSVSESNKYYFSKIDICNTDAIYKLLIDHNPCGIINLAAESHVDRSIDGPKEFINTNVIGTFSMLEATRKYIDTSKKSDFKFLHISTDEVYGDLIVGEPGFTELHSYDPSSPYSASKASSDHLVRAWNRTFGIKTNITNCSNNYGPFHFPEKLIPLTILNAIHGQNLPIYGKGEQIRDWLYVNDHASAIYKVFCEGTNGETYNIGGKNEYKNIDIVNIICEKLDKEISTKPNSIDSFKDLINFVDDRPGHDYRYAIDPKKIEEKLDWTPSETFDSGITKTIKWYIENEWWWKPLFDKEGKRLGGIK